MEPFEDIWDLRRKGLADEEAYNEELKKIIFEHPELILQEELFFIEEGKLFKIRIPIVEDYHFELAGPGEQGIGMGNIGDEEIIDLNPEDGDGTAGDQPGADLFGADESPYFEVSKEQLFKVLFEYYNLPWLDKRKKQDIEEEDLELLRRTKSGSWSKLDLIRTYLQMLKRKAVEQGSSSLHKTQEFGGDKDDVVFKQADLIFKAWEEVKDKSSSAMVYLLLDSSGSMAEQEITLAKAFFLWVVMFLREKYSKVTIVFLKHHVEPWVVDNEKLFFQSEGSGGTMFSPSYKFILHHALSQPQKDSIDFYMLHATDGDNIVSDYDGSIKAVTELIKDFTMCGYLEIRLRGSRGTNNASDMFKAFKKDSFLGKHRRFLRHVLTDRGDIPSALKTFFTIEAESR